MPDNPGSLTKAFQIHELTFFPDGTVKGKLMPNDDEDFFIKIGGGQRRWMCMIDANFGFICIVFNQFMYSTSINFEWIAVCQKMNFFEWFLHIFFDFLCLHIFNHLSTKQKYIFVSTPKVGENVVVTVSESYLGNI